jgi:hypothetical protein
MKSRSIKKQERRLTMAEAKPQKTGLTFHLVVVQLVEKIVEFFKGLLNTKLLAFCIKWLTLIGHYAIMAAAVLGFLFALIYAIRRNELDIFLYGIGWLILIFVAQYIAKQFLPAGETLIKNNPTQLASKAFLDCFGFLILIGGLYYLIMGIVAAIRFVSIELFLSGLAVFFLMEFIALVSFNPGDINIKIVKDNPAGQEAIGIVTFFIKGFMKLVPIFFGVFIVVGTIFLFIDFIGLFGSRVNAAWLSGYRNAQNILGAAFLPFIAYLLFVLAYLAIDVIKAILSIPEKLDKLGK